MIADLDYMNLTAKDKIMDDTDKAYTNLCPDLFKDLKSCERAITRCLDIEKQRTGNLTHDKCERIAYSFFRDYYRITGSANPKTFAKAVSKSIKFTAKYLE